MLLAAAAAAAAAAAGLAGCSGSGRWYPSEMGQDERILRGAVSSVERLVERYRAAIGDGAEPVKMLQAMLDRHEAHLAALRARLPDRGGAEDGGDGSPEPVPEGTADGVSPAPSPEPLPDAPPGLGDLQTAEEAAAVARTEECAQVLEPALGQLLAAVGACGLGHVHLLSEEAG